MVPNSWDEMSCWQQWDVGDDLYLPWVTPKNIPLFRYQSRSHDWFNRVINYWKWKYRPECSTWMRNILCTSPQETVFPMGVKVVADVLVFVFSLPAFWLAIWQTRVHRITDIFKRSARFRPLGKRLQDLRKYSASLVLLYLIYNLLIIRYT